MMQVCWGSRFAVFQGKWRSDRHQNLVPVKLKKRHWCNVHVKKLDEVHYFKYSTNQRRYRNHSTHENRISVPDHVAISYFSRQGQRDPVNVKKFTSPMDVAISISRLLYTRVLCLRQRTIVRILIQIASYRVAFQFIFPLEFL